MICFRTHLVPTATGYGVTRVNHMDHSLAQFLYCQISWSGLTYPLILAGFLDSHKEGGGIFFRWDWWNSNHRKAWKIYRETGVLKWPA